LEIKFPIQGLHAGLSHQDQPPLTSFSLQNVMPLNIDEERMTGGQRPGMSKAFSTQVGGSFPVTNIVQVTTTYIVPGV
jgi:hypothetical protein